MPLPLWMTSITNGDFEDGNTTWSESSSIYGTVITSDIRNSARSGSWYAWLGGQNNEVSQLAQTVRVPNDASYLRFYYRASSADVCGNDIVRVSIDSVQVHEIDLCNSASSWTATNVDVMSVRGSDVLLSFDVALNASGISHFLLDDVGFVANTSDDLYFTRLNTSDMIVDANQPR